MPPLETAVRLTPLLEVAPDCLGAELVARIEGTEYGIALPVHDGRPNSAVFLPPPSASEALRTEPWDSLDPWAQGFRMTDVDEVASYAVYRVVLFGSPSGGTTIELAVAASQL